MRHKGHPEPIQDAAIGMSAAHTKCVSDNLGNAQVSYDKLHVIQNLVRRAIKSGRPRAVLTAVSETGWSGSVGWGAQKPGEID